MLNVAVKPRLHSGGIANRDPMNSLNTCAVRRSCGNHVNGKSPIAIETAVLPSGNVTCIALLPLGCKFIN